KMVAPLSSWIGGKNEEISYLYDDMDEQIELMRSERGGEGTDAINAILGTKAFNHSKPPSLIRSLIGQSSARDDLVLDFFAGSGTTAQAVLECNRSDGEEAGRRRFILVSNTEASVDEPNKNICRDVCARRVKNVIEGYGSAPGLGGDFAYLICRRIEAGLLVDIKHEQVWLALQMIHRETLEAYSSSDFLQAGDSDEVLIYVPRFHASLVPALRSVVEERAAVMLYSWQPETLRQHIRADHVQHEAIPESLARRFGMKG
ncbi:DNA methyltransferase, partial [Bradyrhizobium sp.]|uniref:DNA methyltransferase n=1 Tax=Bradyrhizobium sp. TaxID=376 RepID=UPI002734027C